METFIIYIAKIGICLGIFMLIYILFLRQTTFFRFNRSFLLFGFLTSLILPSLKYTYDIIVPATLSAGMDSFKESEITVSNSNIQIWTILLSVYIAGMLVIIFRNIYAYYKLLKLIRGGTRLDNEEFKLVDNIKVGSPFSILNYILLNTSKLSQTEKDLILKHEIVHIKQKHWIDLLCSEFIIMIQWFNPLAWFYVQLLKENHEFLADKAVLDSGVSPAIYQAVLVNQEFKEPIFSFSNSFKSYNYTKSLKRLAMMKKTKSSPWKKALILTIIPVFGLFLWVSAEPRYILETSVTEKIIDDSILLIASSKIDTAITSDSVLLLGKVRKVTYKKTAKNEDEPFVMTNIPITSEEKKPLTFRSANLKEKPIYIVDDVRRENIEDIDPNTIESISVLKDESAKQIFGEDAKDGAIIITTKEKVKTDKDKALIIIDGVVKEGISISSLNSENISSMNVLKDKAAVSKYGDKAKYGAIEIVTKK